MGYGYSPTMDEDDRLHIEHADGAEIRAVLSEVERRFSDARNWTEGFLARSRWGRDCLPWDKRARLFTLHGMIIRATDDLYGRTPSSLFVCCASQQACSVAVRKMYQVPEHWYAMDYVNALGLEHVRQALAAAKQLPTVNLPRIYEPWRSTYMTDEEAEKHHVPSGIYDPENSTLSFAEQLEALVEKLVGRDLAT